MDRETRKLARRFVNFDPWMKTNNWRHKDKYCEWMGNQYAIEKAIEEYFYGGDYTGTDFDLVHCHYCGKYNRIKIGSLRYKCRCCKSVNLFCFDCGTFVDVLPKGNNTKYCLDCMLRRERARKRHWANNKRIKERNPSEYFKKMALSTEKWRYEKELASFNSRKKKTKPHTNCRKPERIDVCGKVDEEEYSDVAEIDCELENEQDTIIDDEF